MEKYKEMATQILGDSKSIRRKAVHLHKELIMNTAATLFLENSYEAVSLDEIANKIGATKGLIYNYFPSKSALLADMFVWNHNLFLEAVNPAYKSQDAPGSKLMKIINAHLEFNYEHSHMSLLVWKTINVVPLDARKKLNKVRGDYIEKFCQVVAEAQQAGEVIEGDSEMIGTSISILLNFLPYQYRKSRNRTMKDILEIITATYFR
jgi:AcrR family transcriptional regulator